MMTREELVASQGRYVLEAAARVLRDVGAGRLQSRYDLSWRMSYKDWHSLGSLPMSFANSNAVDWVNSKLFGLRVVWSPGEEQGLELVMRPVHR